MKITKYRLQKIINNKNKQTKKKFKQTNKHFKHNNTSYKRTKPFNLRNTTVKQMY
jgi:hypothetical protein